MPEAPEVEIMVDRLRRWRGWCIKDVKIDKRMTLKAAAKYLPNDEYNNVIGQCITDVCRRGKFIVMLTSSGALLCHNAMSGYWDSTIEPWTFDYVEGDREPSDNDVRVELMVECMGDVWTLRFHDARMFGSLHFMDPAKLAEKLDKLGPEALITQHAYMPFRGVNAETFHAALQSKKPVKEVICEQERMTGVGNIYSVEALWRAGISPHRPANGLTDQEEVDLRLSIQEVLRNAIDRRLDYSGLQVYRRQKCAECGGNIRTEELKGRTIHWCPQCQK